MSPMSYMSSRSVTWLVVDMSGQIGQTDPRLLTGRRVGWGETPHKFAIELDGYTYRDRPSTGADRLARWDRRASLVKTW